MSLTCSHCRHEVAIHNIPLQDFFGYRCSVHGCRCRMESFDIVDRMPFDKDSDYERLSPGEESLLSVGEPVL